MADVVLDLISAGAVSKALSAAGCAKDAKIGRQGRPYEALPRTGGFQARQELPWRVGVWQRQSDEQARAATYTRMTEALAERGYHVELRTEHGRDQLAVTRLRPPTSPEWAALDHLAGSPLMMPAGQIRQLHETGAANLTADAFNALYRSGLIEISKHFPLLRDPGRDTYPEHGSVISLSSSGLTLLIQRNKARESRGLWALIAPEQRSAEPPPLLAGDPGRPRPEPVEV